MRLVDVRQAMRIRKAKSIGEAGDAPAARDRFAALLKTWERVRGADHSYTLAARQNLAYWTGEAGDAASARDQFAALLPHLSGSAARTIRTP